MDLSSNQIKSIFFLREYKNLKCLLLGKNPLKKLDVLLELPRLQGVDLRGNPFLPKEYARSFGVIREREQEENLDVLLDYIKSQK